MTRSKRIISTALAGMTVVSTANPSVLLVNAETRTNGKSQMSITSGSTKLHLTTTDIQLFKDAGRTTPVAFTLSNEDEKDYINITETHDSDDVFYYRLTNAGSKPIEDNSSSEIRLKKILYPQLRQVEISPSISILVMSLQIQIFNHR